MSKRTVYIKQVLSLVLLVFYLFSFLPSFISHDHSDNHSDHEGLACEDLSEEVDLHSNCLHAQHIKEKEKKCVLCDYDAFYDHAIFFNSQQSKTRLFIDHKHQFSNRLCLKKKTEQSNKSPPILRLV